MKIEEIEAFFKENVSQQKLNLISIDKETNLPVVNSSKLSFDFDLINTRIKTSDTIYFKDGKIIFVEFKRGKITKKDFRLKATESIISFLNYAHENKLLAQLCLPCDYFQIYFVYDKDTATAPKLFTFSEVEKGLKQEYKHLFSKLRVIDNYNFKKLFGI